MHKLDILAFGAHPDDVELGCGGTLLGAVAEGKKVGVIDLTLGELGTRGTVEQRLKEAKNAAEIMGIGVRENLGMADGFFENNKANQLLIIETIRRFQPSIVFCNAPADRHPDHGRASKLVEDASFLAGLSKIETSHNGVAQLAWRPTQVFHYIQSRGLTPNFVVDISAHMDKKMESILAHSSQFYDPNSKEPETFISGTAFLEFVKGRAKELGQQIGVQYAEGFITNKMLGIGSLDAIIQNKT
ncbi:MAG: bacillithiol biosynthesis deacetylase BshB1 [Bacteroidota bacterium]|jgi:bacillithiol biosynthesis deacetylase BshB1